MMSPIVAVRKLNRNQLSSSDEVEITPGSKDALNNATLEGNDIIIEGAEVSFEAPANSGLVLPQNLFIPTAGTIFAGGIQTTGLEIISVALGSQLRQSPIFSTRGAVVTVLATIKFEGKTVAGRDVESPEFVYPIDICAGCLLEFPAEALSNDGGGQTCNPTLLAEEPEFDDVCFVGQDTAVPCTFCWRLVGDAEAASSLCDP